MNKFTIKDMLNNAVHYGHTTKRWNPKMKPYIYGTYNNTYVIDLTKTAPMLVNALNVIQDTVTNGGRVLFVGTKKQASNLVEEYAVKCGQYYVNHRWLGGMITNWSTIVQSLYKLEQIDDTIKNGMEGLTKKEKLGTIKQKNKLDIVFSGIRNMGGLPDLLFVIDSNREVTAIQEAKKAGIPIVAITDTNADPTDITYPIPGNDDAIKAIRFYCDMVSQVIIDGLKQEQEHKKDTKPKETVVDHHAKVKKATEDSPTVKTPVQSEQKVIKSTDVA